jgi:hypothetical protein
MIGREHDQRVLESDLLIDIGEEISERPVELQDIVLRLEARGADSKDSDAIRKAGLSREP